MKDDLIAPNHETHSDAFQAEFSARVEPIMGRSLSDSQVLIIGNGSVGSMMSTLLVRSGVRRLILIDDDHVSASNLSRSEYTSSDIGIPKVTALARHLQLINPTTSIESTGEDLTRIPDECLENMIRRSQLVIAVTDSPEAQGIVNCIAYPITPCLFVGLYAGAEFGEIIFTLPNETACYECILGELLRSRDLPLRGTPDYGRVGRMVGEPGLGPDIAHVSAVATKIALALLARGAALPAMENIIRPSHSVLLIANRPGWIFPNSFQTVWAKTSRNDSCCACHPDLDAIDGGLQ